MKRNLTKSERLRKKSDIDRVFAGGQSVSCYGARLLFRENGLPYSRIVCIPARKFGNSVERNLARRHIKEIFRQEKEQIVTGYDMAVVIYPGSTYDYGRRKDQLLTLLHRAGFQRP